MRKYISISLILICLPYLVYSQNHQTTPTQLIQLHLTANDYKPLREAKIKLIPGFDDSLCYAAVTEIEAALLKERGYKFELIMASAQKTDLYKRALYGESMKLDPVYHTYEEIISEINSYEKKYPNLISKKIIGRTSQEKRDIYALKISDNVQRKEDEPSILFTAAIHSDELPGVEICMTLINNLLENYNKDPKITDWVNNYEIWFVPVLNVDGHHVVTSNINPRWRKNTRDNNNNGILYEKSDGIDLNRNFDYNWAHGGSSDSTSARYRGEMPFSESECTAFAKFAAEQKFVLSITYHSQGEVIFYPWDWEGIKAPDNAVLTKIANGLGKNIRTIKGDTTYVPHYGAAKVGQTYSWLYGKIGTFDFVIETGKNRHIFPPDILQNIVNNNLQGAFYILDCLKGPGLTGLVTDAKTGKPLEAEIRLPDIDTQVLTNRTSSKTFGRFYRLLTPGSYRMIISKQGYKPVILDNVSVNDKNWTTLNIQLESVKNK